MQCAEGGALPAALLAAPTATLSHFKMASLVVRVTSYSPSVCLPRPLAPWQAALYAKQSRGQSDVAVAVVAT